MNTTTLCFEENYESYSDFYDDNIIKIYQGIINLFEQISNNKDETFTLHIESKIDGLDWDCDFRYNIKNLPVLKRDLLPFFEKIEDYKTCIKIRSLIKELNGV